MPRAIVSVQHLAALGALVAATACGGGGGGGKSSDGGPDPTGAPAMALSAATLSFTATAGGGNPPRQTVTVANAGTGTLSRPSVNVAYRSGAGWLTASASGDATPYTVAVDVAVGLLDPGSYGATIALSCAGASNSPKTIAVALEVGGSPALEARYFPDVPSVSPDATNASRYARPAVEVDAQGGMHLLYRAGSRIRYGHCPAGCTGPEAWRFVDVGDTGAFADAAWLAVDAGGRPHAMWQRQPFGGGSHPRLHYATCGGDCARSESWQSVELPFDTMDADDSPWFALDAGGRPRFVHQTRSGATPGISYGYCDSRCTVAASWRHATVLEGEYAYDLSLAFGTDGRPHLLYDGPHADPSKRWVSYLACIGEDCSDPASWSDPVGWPTGLGPRHALAVHGTRPRVALFFGTTGDAAGALAFLACDADCTTPGDAWSATDVGAQAPAGLSFGEAGLDLALDGAGRPRIAAAFAREVSSLLPDGLAYLDCPGCPGGETWRGVEIDTGATLDALYPITSLYPACTTAAWFAGLKPSLALDPSGDPRIAYVAEGITGGPFCYADPELILVRLAAFPMP